MTGDFFGYELALHSSTLVVGAPFNDEAGSEAGAAYVFDRPDSDWNPVPKKLLPRASDGTGYRMGLGTIGLDDGLLMIPALDKIQAYELDPSGTWMDDTLEPPRGLVARESSWRAVIHGGKALLAVGTTDNVGMGLLYERKNAAWRFVERLESGSPSPQDDVFGWTIAYDGTTACFGAIFADEQDGKVYFFDLSQ
jgi:hypothetical protein